MHILFVLLINFHNLSIFIWPVNFADNLSCSDDQKIEVRKEKPKIKSIEPVGILSSTQLAAKAFLGQSRKAACSTVKNPIDPRSKYFVKSYFIVVFQWIISKHLYIIYELYISSCIHRNNSVLINKVISNFSIHTKITRARFELGLGFLIRFLSVDWILMH